MLMPTSDPESVLQTRLVGEVDNFVRRQLPADIEFDLEFEFEQLKGCSIHTLATIRSWERGRYPERTF